MITREEALAIKADAEKRWLSEDGLMKLHPEASRAPYPGEKLETVDHDNGILFVVIYYWLLKYHGILDAKDQKRFYGTIQRLWKPGTPGILLRNPGRIGRDEGHDNYKGAISGCVLFTFQGLIEDILLEGVKRGFVMEHTDGLSIDELDPHLQKRMKTWWYQFLGFDLTRWKSGSDIAFYKMSRGWMPMMWNYLWMLIHIVINAFAKIWKNGIVDQNQDGTFMAWLRMNALRQRYHELKLSLKWKVLFEITEIFHQFWEVMLYRKTKGKGMEIILSSYFKHPEQPINRLAEGIVYGSSKKA